MVGVDAQMFCCLLAVGNDLAQQAVNLTVAGNRVNRAIRRVGKPGALLDDAVGWVFAENERENAVDCVGLAQHIQLTRGDVRGNVRFRWAACSPLVRVAVLRHKRTGMSINGENLRQVGGSGKRNHKKHSFCKLPS